MCAPFKEQEIEDKDTNQYMAEAMLKDMNLSTEEMGRLKNAMKDPKFTELLNEYAQEISEPTKKEEAESYLKMVEERFKKKEYSMEGKELIIPIPCFCIKTKDKKTSLKFFINICHCEKLERPTSNLKIDGSGAEWQIPFILGPIHKCKDKGGSGCQVVDFVVNQEACERSKERRYFKCFLAQTAIDSIEKQYDVQLEHDMSFPKLTYKGSTSNPKMLAIPSPTKTKNQEKSQPKPTHNENVKQMSEMDTFVTKTKEKKQDDLLATPSYDIVYRSDLDLSEFWMDNNDKFKKENRAPKELVLRVNLPEVESASEVQLDVSNLEALLKVPKHYALRVKWKYPVESSKACATFDKSTHKLEVKLPTSTCIS